MLVPIAKPLTITVTPGNIAPFWSFTVPEIRTDFTSVPGPTATLPFRSVQVRRVPLMHSCTACNTVTSFKSTVILWVSRVTSSRLKITLFWLSRLISSNACSTVAFSNLKEITFVVLSCPKAELVVSGIIVSNMQNNVKQYLHQTRKFEKNFLFSSFFINLYS